MPLKDEMYEEIGTSNASATAVILKCLTDAIESR